MNEEVKMQASNITEEGEVLFLDEERMSRKANGYERYKTHSNGIGFFNLFKEILCAKPQNYKFIVTLFRALVKASAWMKKDGFKSNLYKKMMMLAPDKERNTSSLVLPLNVDLTEQSQKVVVPMDIIKLALKQASFIGAMDKCLCREAGECAEFPHDLGCLFLGEGGRTAVKHGIAREFTYEEACARVDRAAELGLCGEAMWVEVEQLIWGFKNNQIENYISICFCCPCCCVGMHISRNGSAEIKNRFHSCGWTAVADRTKCIGCGKCIAGKNPCPQDAIKIGKDGKVEINQEVCVGCGICKTKCDQGVIKIKQTMPVKKDLHEYFLDDFNVDLNYFD